MAGQPTRAAQAEVRNLRWITRDNPTMVSGDCQAVDEEIKRNPARIAVFQMPSCKVYVARAAAESARATSFLMGLDL